MQHAAHVLGSTGVTEASLAALAGNGYQIDLPAERRPALSQGTASRIRKDLHRLIVPPCRADPNQASEAASVGASLLAISCAIGHPEAVREQARSYVAMRARATLAA